MSQETRGSTNEPWRAFLLQVGSLLNGHRVLLTLVTAGLLPAGSVVCSVVGQDRQDLGDWGYIGTAGLLLVVAGCLQMLSGWAADQVTELEMVAADRLRVTLKDALQPVAEMIADMVPQNRPQRQANLGRVTDQAVGALRLIFADVDRVRSTVYRLNSDGDLVYMSYGGRGEGVQPQPFRRLTTRGEPALAMVRGRTDIFVEDVDAVDEGSPEYQGSRSGYKTFISCSIADKTSIYGMVTVDAPSVGDLTDTDRQLVGLMSDLLAIAFATAARGQQPRVGSGVTDITQ
ncbi:GAF domain-containing protein [Mycolicibacterium sp. A43C]